jgi:hypothetical protein
MKSWDLKFVESSGPFQACNGTELPLPLPFIFFSASILLFIWEIKLLTYTSRDAVRTVQHSMFVYVLGKAQVEIMFISFSRKIWTFINPSAWSDGHCPHTVNITCRGVTGTARIQ